MDVEEAIKTRRAVREYEQREISDEQLRELFELVKYAPSGYNLQPWEFIVVRDLENKKVLRKCANDQKHVEEASAVIVLLGNTSLLAYLDEISVDERKLQKIQKMAEKTKEEREIWARQNTNLAAMTLMLAAQSMGFSTCPIGAFDRDGVRKAFNIPEGFEIVLMITLGYGKNIPQEAPKRRGCESILHFEKL